MVALFAFLHHVAAFALVAAVVAEFVLLKGELTIENVRRLLAVDAIFGASAGIVGLRYKMQQATRSGS